MNQVLSPIKNLILNRELLWVWTVRDIKVRYKQSILGIAWSILQPLSLMLIFTVIFTVIVRVPTEGIPYPLFSYCALLPWTFFSSSITFGLPSLIQNMSLVTKIYFPKEILPISAILAGLLDFSIAFLVFVGLLIFYKIDIKSTVFLLPFVLAVQVVLTAGLTLFMSALIVFYRDIRFIVPLVIQVWMYATPVIYPMDLVPEKFRNLYMINPMAGIVESYRSILLRGEWPDWGSFAIASAISVLLFVFGYTYFKKVEWQFADLI